MRRSMMRYLLSAHFWSRGVSGELAVWVAVMVQGMFRRVSLDLGKSRKARI